MLYLAFVFGLIFGSFLNVVIYRLNPAPQLRGGVFGRSFCPNCKTQLKWHDLAPILSFIRLYGRCGYCNEKISWQYPIVEFLSGILWVGVFYKNFNNNFFPFGGSPVGGQLSILNFQFIFNHRLFDVFYQIFIFSVLLVVAVYDFKWKIIPDKIIYPAIAAALVFNLFKFFVPAEHLPKGENLETFAYSFLVAAAAFLFFFALFYFSKGRAMGLGDAKLAFLIGLFLSPFSALLAFMSAFVVGAAFGILLIVLGRTVSGCQGWSLKSRIAFGPFMVFGAAVIFFFSDFIFRVLNFLNFLK